MVKIADDFTGGDGPRNTWNDEPRRPANQSKKQLAGILRKVANTTDPANTAEARLGVLQWATRIIIQNGYSQTALNALTKAAQRAGLTETEINATIRTAQIANGITERTTVGNPKPVQPTAPACSCGVAMYAPDSQAAGKCYMCRKETGQIELSNALDSSATALFGDIDDYLKSRPDRCPDCGNQPATQGHLANCDSKAAWQLLFPNTNICIDCGEPYDQPGFTSRCKPRHQTGTS